MNIHIIKTKIAPFLVVAIIAMPSLGYAATTPSSSTDSPARSSTTDSPAVPAHSTSNEVTTLTNPLKGVNSVSDLIFTFMKIISYIAVIFGVLMLMWVGLQFVLAQGKPEEIKKRSNQLLWVIVGIGIILGARILVSVIINTLDATGSVNSSVIQSAQNAIPR
ncbi:MAG: pilin [Candidatus Pacebacteria bacterium]|nr:pilin [Candidatus Paceibacterota bacterium]